MAEDDLIRRARLGDQDAFRQLVDSYGMLTERTARVLLADRSDAEDAVQEAWLDAWRGLRSFEVGRPFRPWLLAVVGNRCRMVARRRKLTSVPFDELLYDRSNGLSEPHANPFSAIEAYYEDLQEALEALDREHKRLLALRFFADLQLEEIAELLNVPLGTVKSRLHRTLQTLRLRLQRQERVENRKR
ncbi:MAG: sigma-70 family RNA polymerase sigma factor [Chloroflexota bacterium]|nr:sigma-70 family RNA polymerase sigma factor [Chloroflexota bacterium]